MPAVPTSSSARRPVRSWRRCCAAGMPAADLSRRAVGEPLSAAGADVVASGGIAAPAAGSCEGTQWSSGHDGVAGSAAPGDAGAVGDAPGLAGRRRPAGRAGAHRPHRRAAAGVVRRSVAGRPAVDRCRATRHGAARRVRPRGRTAGDRGRSDASLVRHPGVLRAADDRRACGTSTAACTPRRTPTSWS